MHGATQDVHDEPCARPSGGYSLHGVGLQAARFWLGIAQSVNELVSQKGLLEKGAGVAEGRSHGLE
jgi:hypothetical protein